MRVRRLKKQAPNVSKPLRGGTGLKRSYQTAMKIRRWKKELEALKKSR